MDAAHYPVPAKVFAGEIVVPDNLVPGCQILHYGHEVRAFTSRQFLCQLTLGCSMK